MLVCDKLCIGHCSSAVGSAWTAEELGRELCMHECHLVYNQQRMCCTAELGGSQEPASYSTESDNPETPFLFLAISIFRPRQDIVISSLNSSSSSFPAHPPAALIFASSSFSLSTTFSLKKSVRPRLAPPLKSARLQRKKQAKQPRPKNAKMKSHQLTTPPAS